jgi:serine/threonine-protein kinase RsbW
VPAELRDDCSHEIHERGRRDAMADTDGSANQPVTLTIPGHAQFLRLVRLAAADTGARAGLSLAELEDLRIAVDELAYALMGDEPSGAPMTLQYAAIDGAVEIEGTCAANGVEAALSDLARTIVGATADVHDIRNDGVTRRFRLVKRTTS